MKQFLTSGLEEKLDVFYPNLIARVEDYEFGLRPPIHVAEHIINGEYWVKRTKGETTSLVTLEYKEMSPRQEARFVNEYIDMDKTTVKGRMSTVFSGIGLSSFGVASSIIAGSILPSLVFFPLAGISALAFYSKEIFAYQQFSENYPRAMFGNNAIIKTNDLFDQAVFKYVRRTIKDIAQDQGFDEIDANAIATVSAGFSRFSHPISHEDTLNYVLRNPEMRDYSQELKVSVIPQTIAIFELIVQSQMEKSSF